MKKGIVCVLVLLLLIVGLSARGGSESNQGIKVVSTTSFVADVVRQVAGDRLDQHLLIPPGYDPHVFEPAPRDVARIERADIVFVNGFGLEEGLLHTIERVARGQVIEVSSGITAISGGHCCGDHDDHDDHHHDAHGHDHHDEAHEHDHHDEAHDHDRDHHDEAHDHDHDYHDAHHDHHDEAHDHDHDHHHHEYDPHTWLSPLNVISWTEVIVETLSAADPANADYYKSNATDFISQLEELHADLTKLFAEIPENKRKFAVDHQVFAYFAREYGVHQVGAIIPNFSSSAEATARDIARLVEQLEAEKVSVVFIGSASGEAVRRLAEALGKETAHDLRVYHLLFDSLGAAGTPEAGYPGFMRSLGTAMHQALMQ